MLRACTGALPGGDWLLLGARWLPVVTDVEVAGTAEAHICTTAGILEGLRSDGESAYIVTAGSTGAERLLWSAEAATMGAVYWGAGNPG
jgi:hypothetical protein